MQRRTLSAFFSVCLGLAISIAFGISQSLASTTIGHFTYIVRPGDTLWAIARHNRVSLSALAQANHLSDVNSLSLGERLSIPGLAAKKPSAPELVALKAHRKVSTGRTLAAMRRSRLTHKPSIIADSPTRMLEIRGLWIATHTAGAPPSLLGPFASAEHLVMLEASLTRTALRYIGVPYVWGGESFYGVDCSGFVQAVFRHNGIELPRTADAQFEVGHHILEADLRPGDLVFFETYTEGASHVGIYLGGGRFVHASASDGVRVDSLSDDYYASRYLGARREAI